MRVYRIEARNGMGPKASGIIEAYHRRACEASRNATEPPLPEHNEPTPFRELYAPMPVEPNPHYMFGCDSLETLRRWFPSPAGCSGMEDEGATLCAFDVSRSEDRMMIDDQVIFNRLTATFLWNLPASVLHTLTDEEAAKIPRSDRIFPERIPPELHQIADLLSTLNSHPAGRP